MWYYANGDEEIGPVSAQELKDLTKDGTVGPETLVWKEGMSDWKPATAIPGLLPGATRPLPRRPSAAASRSADSNPYYAGSSAAVVSQYPPNATIILILGLLSLSLIHI